MNSLNDLIWSNEDENIETTGIGEGMMVHECMVLSSCDTVTPGVTRPNYDSYVVKGCC